MSHPIRHPDLVARALDALPPAEKARVDEALARDEALRRRFEQVAGHLLQYDHMPPAPPPPPFERLAQALDEDARGDAARPDLRVLALQAAPRRRLAPVAFAAAAAVLVAVLAWRPWDTTPPVGPTLVPGRGIQLTRDGRALPAPALAALPVRPGDVLGCEEMAEARLGRRVRLVLDGGSRLRVDGEARVTLLDGRAWFEVERRDPARGGTATWEVDTAFGPVRVLGTMFEVDVRRDALAVGVARGVVEAAGRRLAAGDRLAAGRVTRPRWPAGAWIDRPEVRLEAGPQAPGAPWRLRLVFENPGQVPLILRGPASARSPLWISLEDAEGRILREVRPDRLLEGGELLAPGARVALAPGASRTMTFEIEPPIASEGTYFCRALHRPEGQPGVLTEPAPIEVRRP